VFVVGDEGLQNADSFGELGLSQTAFTPEPSQAAADGLAMIVEGREFQTGDTGHSPLRYHTLFLVWKFSCKNP